MGPFTPQTQDSTVYQLAAQLMADATNDGDRARIDRALDLVATVERTNRPGVWLVRSASQPDRAYRVEGQVCSCADHAKRQAACKHYWATVLAHRLERMDAEAHDPILEIVVRPEDEAIPYELTGLALLGEPCDLAPLAATCILCREPVQRVTRSGECLPCVNAYMFPEGA
jgi:hypothetical protein